MGVIIARIVTKHDVEILRVLFNSEIYWVVMIDGSYQKTDLLHALAGLSKQPRSSLLDLRGCFDNKERTLVYE